jgi:hypothetical protein
LGFFAAADRRAAEGGAKETNSLDWLNLMSLLERVLMLEPQLTRSGTTAREVNARNLVNLIRWDMGWLEVHWDY